MGLALRRSRNAALRQIHSLRVGSYQTSLLRFGTHAKGGISSTWQLVSDFFLYKLIRHSPIPSIRNGNEKKNKNDKNGKIQRSPLKARPSLVSPSRLPTSPASLLLLCFYRPVRPTLLSGSLVGFRALGFWIAFSSALPWIFGFLLLLEAWISVRSLFLNLDFFFLKKSPSIIWIGLLSWFFIVVINRSMFFHNSNARVLPKHRELCARFLLCWRYWICRKCEVEVFNNSGGTFVRIGSVIYEWNTILFTRKKRLFGFAVVCVFSISN